MHIKLTKQGEKIYEVIQQSNGHMTVDEIHSQLKQRGIHIGIATVYRNLNILYDNKLINRVKHPELGYIYDRNLEDHYHFYDIETKRIYDVDIDYQADLDKLIEQKYGVKVASNSIIFEGYSEGVLDEKKTKK